MSKTVTIKGNGILDEQNRVEALQYLQDNATTEELIKLKKLAQNPTMRAMLKSI